MSGVVLRCPNCGTTRSDNGECEACHEAQVRYFCTNHAPGRWLDAGACGPCGARFGDPVPMPVPAPGASPTGGRPPAPQPRTSVTPAAGSAGPPAPWRRLPVAPVDDRAVLLRLGEYLHVRRQHSADVRPLLIGPAMVAEDRITMPIGGRDVVITSPSSSPSRLEASVSKARQQSPAPSSPSPRSPASAALHPAPRRQRRCPAPGSASR